MCAGMPAEITIYLSADHVRAEESCSGIRGVATTKLWQQWLLEPAHLSHFSATPVSIRTPSANHWNQIWLLSSERQAFQTSKATFKIGFIQLKFACASHPFSNLCCCIHLCSTGAAAPSETLHWCVAAPHQSTGAVFKFFIFFYPEALLQLFFFFLFLFYNGAVSVPCDYAARTPILPEGLRGYASICRTFEANLV